MDFIGCPVSVVSVRGDCRGYLSVDECSLSDFAPLLDRGPRLFIYTDQPLSIKIAEIILVQLDLWLIHDIAFLVLDTLGLCFERTVWWDCDCSDDECSECSAGSSEEDADY